jgi:hypothetical protein
VVTLDGSRSFDPDGLPAGSSIADGRFTWTQVGGPAVTLNAPATAHPSFQVPGPGDYVFSLRVSDSLDTSADAFVTVMAAAATPIPDAGATAHALLAVGLAAVALLLVRRII